MSRTFAKTALLWAIAWCSITMVTAGTGKKNTSLQAAAATGYSTLTLTELRQPVKQARVRVFDENGVRSQAVEKTDDLGYATVDVPVGTQFKFEVKVNEDIYFSPMYVAPANVRFDTLNKAPVTTATAASTAEDAALAITLTATDPENDPLTYAVVTQPTNGVLTGTAPNLTYTPNPDFFGTDSFTFQANDNLLKSAPATVTITVNPVNDAPVASAIAVAAVTDVPTAITLLGTDVDNTDLSYVVVKQPAHGTLTGTGATLTYTHTADVYGTDSFTYKVNDGQADSQVATVAIEVTAPFVITVNATDGTFTIPLKQGLTYDFTVNYDGLTTTHTNDQNLSLTFPSGAGVYDVAISGTFPAIYFNGIGDTAKMVDVKQWGSTAWQTLDSAFENCTTMTVTATDTPNFSAVTNMDDAFWKCRGITSITVGGWDVSNVTSMIQAFRGCTNLGEYVGINNWDVSKVTTFHRAFYFNQSLVDFDLSNWNTTSAEDFSYMFYRCYRLTGLTGYQNWNVSKATSFRYMFERVGMTSIDVSNWTTTDALVDLYAMFAGAQATEIKGLDKLDVTSVTYADTMFNGNQFQMTTPEYDALLIAWSEEMTGIAATSIIFDAGTVKYTPFGAAEAARDNLIAHNWVINDGGTDVGIDPFTAKSITSPVRVSGWNNVPSSEFTISTDGGTTYGAVTPWGDTLWYNDVTLNPAAPVAVSVKYGETVVKSEAIAWTPTLIDDNTDQSVTIRKGHSLLLGSANTVGTLLEIDTDGDGIYDLSGAPTDKFPVKYDEYGTFEVLTRIDGMDYGYMIVSVPEVQFPQNVACEIGFTRELTVGVPDDAVGITFSALNGAEISVVQDVTATLPGTVKLLIKPLKSGTPTIVAKAASGAILETKVVDEFDLASQADKFIGVVDEFEDGSMLLRTNLTMFPKVENLEVRLHIFKAGVTFDDSTLDKIVNTSDFTPDEETGLFLHPYEILVPPEYVGGPCHTIKVFQDGVQIGQ